MEDEDRIIKRPSSFPVFSKNLAVNSLIIFSFNQSLS